jgi:hypothetical protein
VSDRVETLQQLLDPDGRGLGDLSIEVLDRSEALDTIRTALRALPGGALADLARGAAAALRQALSIKVGDVVAAGWNTGRRLLKYRDAKRYPPEDVIDVPLGEHTIRSRHEPRVAVLVNDVPVGEIPFTVTLAFTVESVVLRVRNGRLVGASPARCRAKGTLSCGKAVLLEQATRTFSLPDLTFDPGLPIA